eukprot:5047673-Ditylum_brightwellii.AAC.1
MPGRFLAGILPTALVERYTFWQSEDDNIIGYEDVMSSDESDGAIPVPSKGASTRLKITLSKGEDSDESGFCNSNAEALVQRVPVLDTDPENEEID